MPNGILIEFDGESRAKDEGRFVVVVVASTTSVKSLLFSMSASRSMIKLPRGSSNSLHSSSDEQEEPRSLPDTEVELVVDVARDGSRVVAVVESSLNRLRVEEMDEGYGDGKGRSEEGE
jgi:hypothetical protein